MFIDVLYDLNSYNCIQIVLLTLFDYIKTLPNPLPNVFLFRHP